MVCLFQLRLLFCDFCNEFSEMGLLLVEIERLDWIPALLVFYDSAFFSEMASFEVSMTTSLSSYLFSYYGLVKVLSDFRSAKGFAGDTTSSSVIWLAVLVATMLDRSMIKFDKMGLLSIRLSIIWSLSTNMY